MYEFGKGDETSVAVTPFPFFSGALYSRKTCYVYTPPSYESSAETPYPVIYLLHGKFGGETDWVQKGSAEATLDRLMNAGEMPECIVVMPNDGGYHHGTFYVDWYDGGGNFEQYIVDDLVTAVDDAFRTVRDRTGRAVAGLSMGGYGAVMLALRNSSLFGAAASMSGALGSIKSFAREDFARSDFGRMFGPQKGAHATGYDVYALAAVQAEQDGERPWLYFDCGRDDYLHGLNVMFNEYLKGIGYGHTYREFAGEHNWSYWTEHLSDTLRFIGSYFEDSPSKQLR